MKPKPKKMNRSSFLREFNTASLEPEKDYTVIIMSKEKGYVPKGLEPSSDPEGREVHVVTGKGKVIEALEDDEKIRFVEAPLRHTLKLS